MAAHAQCAPAAAFLVAPSPHPTKTFLGRATIAQPRARALFALRGFPHASRLAHPRPRVSASANDRAPAPSQPNPNVPPIWRLLAETAIQLTVAGFAIAASVVAKTRFFAFASAFLCVPQVALSVRRYLTDRALRYRPVRLVEKPEVPEDVEEEEELEGSEEQDWPDTSAPIRKVEEPPPQPVLTATAIRTVIAEEVDTLRYAIEQVETSTLQREQGRNRSIAEAIASLDGGIRALRRTVETRNQVQDSAPFAIVSELELVRSRLKDAEQEKTELQIRVQTAEANFEEAKRQGKRARREADEAVQKELHLRAELASVSSRLSRLDDITDRLDRAERLNDELRERLVMGSREQEELRQSAADAERQVLRVENISQLLRERLESFSRSASEAMKGDRRKEGREDNDLEAEEKFWEKRLRRQGSLDKSSLLYQELMGEGEDLGVAREWPEGPLQGGKKREKSKSQIDKLPADGGFGAFKTLGPEREQKQLASSETGVPELPGGAGETIFSFSRGEFDGSEKGAIGQIEQQTTEQAEETTSMSSSDSTSSRPGQEGTTGAVMNEWARPSQSGLKQEQHAEGALTSQEYKEESTLVEERRIEKDSRSESSQDTTDRREVEVGSQETGQDSQSLDRAKRDPEVSQRVKSEGSSTDVYLRNISKRERGDPVHSSSPTEPRSPKKAEKAQKRPRTNFGSSLQGQSDGMHAEPQKPTAADVKEPSKEEEGLANEESLQTSVDQEDHQTVLGQTRPSQESVEIPAEGSEELNKNVNVTMSRHPTGNPVSNMQKVPAEQIAAPFTTNGASESGEIGLSEGQPHPRIDSNEQSETQPQTEAPSQPQVLGAKAGSEGQDDSPVLERDVPEASERAEEAPKKAPTAPELVQSADDLVKKARRRGLALSQANVLFSRAVSKLEAAEQLGTDRAVVEAQSGSTLLAWAKANLADKAAKERLTSALAHLSSSLKLRPEDETTIFNTGLCLCLLASTGANGRAKEYYERACEFYDELLRLNSESRIGAFNCGLAYISFARLALAEDDADAEACVGYFETAAGRFRKSLELKPGDAKALSYLKDCQRHIAELME